MTKEMTAEDKKKFERAEFERKKQELQTKVMNDMQDPNTTTIVFMRRRVSEIIFRFSEGSTKYPQDTILFALHQAELKEFRLIEIKLLLPYLKILYIPRDATKPEQSHNINADRILESFDMTYVDACTDCGNPRNPLDRTVAI